MGSSSKTNIEYAVRDMSDRLVNEYFKFLQVIVNDVSEYTTNFEQGEEGKTVQFADVQCAFENLKAKINTESSCLFRTVSEKIAAYASDFSVDTTRMDAYKFFYWFCETCIEWFPTGIESQLAKLGMSRGMGELLHLDIGKRLSPVMSKKIRQTVLTGRTGRVFGVYGLYKVFKNCSLLCRDTCGLFPKSQYEHSLFHPTAYLHT